MQKPSEMIVLEALRAAITEGRDSGPADPVQSGELVERIKARGRERLKAAKDRE